MTIRFQCPSCGAPKEAKDEWAGKTARCKCGATFSIPVPVVEDYTDVPMAEPLPEEDTVSFDTFEANDPAPSNNLFADLGDFGAPAQPQPYGNYVPYQMPAPAPSQPVTGKKGAQSQAQNAPPSAAGTNYGCLAAYFGLSCHFDFRRTKRGRCKSNYKDASGLCCSSR